MIIIPRIATIAATSQIRLWSTAATAIADLILRYALSGGIIDPCVALITDRAFRTRTMTTGRVQVAGATLAEITRASMTATIASRGSITTAARGSDSASYRRAAITAAY